MVLFSLPQCFTAYGRTCANAETFAFVSAVVFDVACRQCPCDESVFALCFCALAGGNDAACEVGMLGDVDLVAVIACVNAALFAYTLVLSVDFDDKNMSIFFNIFNSKSLLFWKFFEIFSSTGI